MLGGTWQQDHRAMEETDESASEARSGSPAPSVYSFNASVDERLIVSELRHLF